MLWFRFYDEAVDDPKVQALAPDIFKVWINLLCLASRSPDPRGILPEAPRIAWILHLPEASIREILTALEEAQLLDRFEGGKLAPHNWLQRQVARVEGAQRQAAFRARKLLEESLLPGLGDEEDPSVTQRHAASRDVTARHESSPKITRVEESRVEERIKSCSPYRTREGGSDSPSPPKPRPSRSRKTPDPLPADDSSPPKIAPGTTPGEEACPYPDPERDPFMIHTGAHEIPEDEARDLWRRLYSGFHSRKLCVGFYEHQRWFPGPVWREAISQAAKDYENREVNSIRLIEAIASRIQTTGPARPPQAPPAFPRSPAAVRREKSNALAADWKKQLQGDAPDGEQEEVTG